VIRIHYLTKLIDLSLISEFFSPELEYPPKKCMKFQYTLKKLICIHFCESTVCGLETGPWIHVGEVRELSALPVLEEFGFKQELPKLFVLIDFHLPCPFT